MASQPDALLHQLRLDILDVLPDFVPGHPVHFCHTPLEAACTNMYNDLVRKLKPDPHSSSIPMLERAAREKFLWANQICLEYRPQLCITEAVLDEVAAILARLPEISFPALFSKARHGPGASVGSRGANSAFEKLFLNEITSYSPDTVYQYLRLVRLFPLYRNAELLRMRRRGANRAFRIVGSSTFSTVRKTVSTDRGICTEASLDMFFQLGAGELINDFLAEEFGYCPTRQPERNRRLALKGSRSGDIATIDMTSASDLNSLGLVSDALRYRRDWFEMLAQLRAPSTRIEVDGQLTTVSCNMISSMGNGFTFPLETLLFSCIVRAVATVLDVPFERFDRESGYGVFGDDVIVPSSIAPTVLAVLRDLGHIPNESKTFLEGPFRESCGVDGFLGQDTRAVFHKTFSRSGRYSTVNHLNRWSARWGVPLRRTVRALLPKGWVRHRIPLYEDPSSGIWAWSEGGTGYFSFALSPPVDYIYQVRRVKENGTRVVTHRLRKRFDNPFGVLACYIDGSLRNGRISRRIREDDVHDDTLRSEVLRTTTHWVCEQELRIAGIARAMWTTMASLNLGT